MTLPGVSGVPLRGFACASGVGKVALEFGQDFSFLCVIHEEVVGMQPQCFRIAGDAVQARLVQSTVFKIPPIVLAVDPRGLCQVFLTPILVFKCQKNLDLQLKEVPATFKRLTRFWMFQFSIQHSFVHASLPLGRGADSRFWPPPWFLEDLNLSSSFVASVSCKRSK